MRSEFQGQVILLKTLTEIQKTTQGDLLLRLMDLFWNISFVDHSPGKHSKLFSYICAVIWFFPPKGFKDKEFSVLQTSNSLSNQNQVCLESFVLGN